MPKTEFQLYRIHEGLGLLFDLIDDAESPLTPEQIGAKIKELYADQTQMFDEVRKAVIIHERQAEVAKAEAARLTELRAKSEARAESLKNMMFQTMELSGLKKVAFSDGGFARIQANGQPSIKFEGDAEKLPEAFRQTIIHDPEYRPDREKILSANEMGLPLPDGVSVVKGSHLRLG